MKKTFSFIAAAAVILAAASCAKEMPVNQEKATSFQESTFSATIERPADSKAIIEDDGVFKFSEGDYILVFNNNPSAEININNSKFTTVEGKYVVYDATETDRVIAEKIPVTASMLTSGGLGITFSTVIGDKASSGNTRANCYHFYYISAGAFPEWAYVNCRPDDNANYICASFYRRQSGNYTADTRKIMCYARSDEKSGQLKFYHVDSQFKFKVSDTSYDKVTFEANGTVGADNSINPDVTFYHGRVLDYTKEYSGDGNLSYNPNEIKSSTHPYWNKGAYTYTHNSSAGQSSIATVTLSGDASSVYYVAMPALYTYASGITIKLYKSGEVLKTLVAGQSITTAAAGIINFGDLAKVKKDEYTSYRDKWIDKVSFKIGETTVNPAEEPYASMSIKYVESDCNLSSVSGYQNTNNIIFIKKGATLTIDKNKYWGTGEAAKLYIIGDEIGTRSNVVWKATLAPRGGAVVLKNINITSSIENSLDSEGGLSSYLVVDGCRIALPSGGNFANAVNGASSGWDRIELVDNDFVYASGVASRFAKVLPTAAYTFSSLVVKNNQSYTTDGTLAGAYCTLIWDSWQHRMSFQSVDIENNTFVNTEYSTSVINGADQGVPVGGNLTIKNNINYVDGAATGYAKLFLLTDGYKTGVNITASNNFAWATSQVSYLQVWGNVSCTVFSADPFESKDFTTGTFVLTSAAQSQAPGCGAQR